MENPPNIPPKTTANEPGLPDEGRVQELIREVNKLLEEGKREAALAEFNQLHPADRGRVLVELDRDLRDELLPALTASNMAGILEHIEPEEAVELSKNIEVSILSKILDETSPDVVADILKDLPQEKSYQTLEAMKEAEKVIPLLKYPDDSAGGLMTPDYPMIREGITSPSALDELRILWPDAENMSSVFIVDDENRLVGSLSVTRLALARPTSMVGEIVDLNVISVAAETDQEECAHLMERYNLNQLPVVDQDHRLIGVILAEDIVDVVEEEATEDMYRMAGISGERVLGPLRNSLRSRLPWLYINLATAFLAALVISIFESTITKVVALAVFLPVVAGQGGIGGTQTVTLLVRSMALGEVPGHLALRFLAREIALGVIHGALLGLVVGLVAYAWKGNPMLGVVLGLAMLGNMVVAALAGAGVPLLLRRLRMDPAVSSAVFVTTFTDVLGFLLFLSLAAAFINFLL